MTNPRIQKTPIGIYILFLGFIVMLAAGFVALSYPSKGSVALIAAGIGLGIVVISLATSPGLAHNIFTARRTWLWVNDIVLVASIIGIAVLLSYIGFRRHIRYDFTRDRLFSISDQTIAILRNLKKEVRITAFFAMGQVEGKMVQDLVGEYQRWNEKLSFKLVDPYRDPLTAKSMSVKTIPSVVVACEANRKELFFDDMFIVPNRMAPTRESPKFIGEQALTSALLNVTQGKRRKVVFSTGNGEPQVRGYAIDGLAGVTQLLDKENFEVGEVDLGAGVATDATILAIVGPSKTFHPQALQNVRDFVQKQKGMLLVALNPDFRDPGFDKLLADLYGTTANPEFIINPQKLLNDVTIVAPAYEEHKIVKDLNEKKIAVLMQLCRGLTFESKPEWNVVPVLKTRDNNLYGKRVSEQVFAGNLEFNPDSDVRGPFNLALAYEGKESASGTRAIVFGCATFFTNQFLRFQGNTDLFLNTMNWMAGQEEMISIRPKSVEFGTIALTADNVNSVKYLSIFAGPLLIMLLGGMVWWSRGRV